MYHPIWLFTWVLESKLQKESSLKALCQLSHTLVVFIKVQTSTFVQKKRNEDEDSLNSLYTLVTYVPVTTFQNLQMVNVGEN